MTVTVEPPYLVDPYRRTERGFRERVNGIAPAAAADYAVTIEGRYVTRLVAIKCLLTTDANVANREVVLEYRDAEANRIMLMGAPVVVTASDTVTYVFQRGQGQAEWSCDDSIIVPLIDEPLTPGESFRLHIVNAQVADTLTVIRYTWERFYTDDTR